MKRFLLILAMLLMAVPVWGADVKISELPAVTTYTGATDIIPIVASDTTSKITITNLFTKLPLFTAKGSLLVSSAAATSAELGIGANGAFLRVATDTPGWSTLILPNAGTQYAIPYYSTANNMGEIANGTTGQIFKATTGAAPSWSDSLTGSLTFGQAAGAGAGYIKFLEDPNNGTNTVQLIGPASTADVIITLPAATGTVQLVKNEKIASFAWDGGGSAVATANSKRCVLIPTAYTVTGYNMVVDQDPGAGTTILNLDKDAIGDGTALATTDMDGTAHAYPPTVPDNKVSVVDTTITGWTTAVSANDMICAAVATNAVATWISLTIYGTR